jgi:16S rRNA (guanine527-N7)-methyltransferase
VRDPAEMLTHHLLDSLAAVLPLQKHLLSGGLLSREGDGAKLLDVGSGAGLPGVVLAICCPALSVTCVDTVGKKAAFITQAALSLGLRNLKGLHARVETIAESFDVICSRAFASLADFTAWSGKALASDGVWMALKGRHPADEIAVLPVGVTVFHVEQLVVPGLDAERCVIWLKTL